MANHQRSFSVDANGLTFDDQVYVFAGTDLPWNITGAENYPEGTRYFRTNGDEYIKGASGSTPAQDDYILRTTGGGGGSQCLAFWDNTGTQSNIIIASGFLPFWDSTGASANISIGSCT